MSHPCTYIWLNKNIETSKHDRDTKGQLQQIIGGRLKTFVNPDECYEYLFNPPTTEKLVLIVSNEFGPSLVSTVHDFPQIRTIYIYCGKREIAQAWSESYSKVAAICTKPDALLEQLSNDFKRSNKNLDMPMSIFHLCEQQDSLGNLSKDSTSFMWYQCIHTVIRLMGKSNNSKNDLIQASRTEYQSDQSEIRKIERFQREYEPSKAIWWYTFDCFLYRLLNKALRTKNFEIIFKFRFFINDIHNQIVKLYQEYLSENSSNENQNLTVYRGQHLTMDELNQIKNNLNVCISMNSFFSATKYKYLAEIYADTGSQTNEASPLQSVLFTIDICNINKHTTSFAFIEKYACNPDEGEILFDIGAIFKVKSVNQRGSVWDINLELSNEKNKFSEDLYQHMLQQIGQEPNEVFFGWFLFRINEFNQAKRYCNLLVEQNSSNPTILASVYNLLGLIAKDTKSLNESIQQYEKAIDMYSKIGLSNDPSLIFVHYNIGLVYVDLDDERNADAHRSIAEEILKNSPMTNDPTYRMLIDTLIAKIHVLHKDYSAAYESFEKVLKVKQTRFPSAHPSIASTMNEMGAIKTKMNNDVEALSHLTNAVKIGEESLGSTQLDLADYHENMGRNHYKCQRYQEALNEFELALSIQSGILREEGFDPSPLSEIIAETRKKLGLS